MPRGIPNKPKTDPAVQGPVVEAAVRTRQELDAAKFTADFLKRNRPNLSGLEQKLAYYGEHPGWVRRWVNDQSNRVPSLLERGWRFVLSAEVGMSDSVGRGNTDIGDRVSITTTAGDGPIRMYLMETTKEIADMQAQARTEPARKTQEAILRGAYQVSDTKHAYQPKWAENLIESKSLQ